MKLNLGCGMRKKDGWVNVDKFAACEPDQILDLEALPWPWADSSVGEVALIHVLEHVGQQVDTYLGIVKELWRVCRDGARIEIQVPHFRHDNFVIDPTHVRPIHPESFLHFSRRRNLEWQRAGSPATPLALYLGVDFEFKSARYDLAPEWVERLRQGMSQAEVSQAVRTFSNVVMDCEIILEVVKAPRPAAPPT